MLAKAHRLKIQLVPSKSVFKTISTPLFTLRIARNNIATSRFGIVVSKKVDKRAVERNRIKRILSSCLQLEEKNIKPGFDIIISPKKESKETIKETICITLTTILKKEQLL